MQKTLKQCESFQRESSDTYQPHYQNISLFTLIRHAIPIFDFVQTAFLQVKNKQL